MTDVHPVADLFPMLSGDELEELAADIKERGLLQPIVLDQQGRILDGRNRLAACKQARVKPQFVTYEGDDPDGYALAVNIARRHLTTGARAILAEQGRRLTGKTQRDVADTNLYQTRVAQAATILDWAPDEAPAVLAGAKAFSAAYKTAQDRKRAAESTEAQMARLRADVPDLADLVDEERMTLGEAMAAMKARAEEDKRRRRVATELLCTHLPGLARTYRAGTAELYDRDMAPQGLPVVTRAVIEDARLALDEIETTWKERDLP